MGMDVCIRLRKPIVCPCCGTVCGSSPVEGEFSDEIQANSGGIVWHDFLRDERIGYETENPGNEPNYGKFVPLTIEQTEILRRFCRKESPPNSPDIIGMIGYRSDDEYIEIEANW